MTQKYPLAQGRRETAQKSGDPITFIAAHAGEVRLYTDGRASNSIIATASPERLAEKIWKHGLDAMLSSTMDFAEEEGFASPDGAKRLLDEAITIAEEARRDEELRRAGVSRAERATIIASERN